jgi:mannose-6-phosphate isomerase-like protein (cupin superfamily)
MVKSEYTKAKPYVTRDGTLIRELLHPGVHGPGRVSLAEAVVAPGAESVRHRHPVAEELYHVTRGEGTLFLDGEWFSVQTGDTVRIPPGAAHAVKNTGKGPLHILCVCVPPYSHGDTVLLPEDGL